MKRLSWVISVMLFTTLAIAEDNNNDTEEFGGIHASFNLFIPQNKEFRKFYNPLKGASLEYDLNFNPSPFLNVFLLKSSTSEPEGYSETAEVYFMSGSLGAFYWLQPKKIMFIYFGLGIKYAAFVETIYGDFTTASKSTGMQQGKWSGFGGNFSAGAKIRIWKKLYFFIKYSLGYTPLGSNKFNVDGHLMEFGFKI